jgi:septation ring formation regulator EzrA
MHNKKQSWHAANPAIIQAEKQLSSILDKLDKQIDKVEEQMDDFDDFNWVGSRYHY